MVMGGAAATMAVCTTAAALAVARPSPAAAAAASCLPWCATGVGLAASLAIRSPSLATA